MHPSEVTDPEQYSVNQSILNKSRQDKFTMVLTLPEAMRDLKSTTRSNDKIDFDTLQFTVYGTPVPKVIVPAVGVPYGGQEVKVSSHTRTAYENIFIDFDVDSLYRNWWVIYKWLDILNDAKQSYYNAKDVIDGEGVVAFKKYSANFTIYGMDEYNNKVIQFDYTGCFPVSLTSPEYTDKETSIINSKFEFAFSFFESHLI